MTDTTQYLGVNNVPLYSPKYHNAGKKCREVDVTYPHQRYNVYMESYINFFNNQLDILQVYGKVSSNPRKWFSFEFNTELWA
jgi:hypothetical protein